MSDRMFRDRIQTESDTVDADRSGTGPSLLAHLGRTASPRPQETPMHTSRSPRPGSRSPRPPVTSTVDQPSALYSASRASEFTPWPVPTSSTPSSLAENYANELLRSRLQFRSSLSNSTGFSTLTGGTGSSLNSSTSVMQNLIGSSPSYHNESELKQKIQALEDTVAEYERQKTNVMGTFAEYRERVTERERKLEGDYSAKIIALSEDVLVAKKDFEARMKQFAELQERFQSEKEGALEKLRKEHEKEMQHMEQRVSESHLLNLEQKYINEIRRLDEERKALRSERDRVGDTFESKLRRAQSLYETELCAAKALYAKELEALKDHEEALKDELSARQEEYRDRLEELQQSFQRSRDELEKCKVEVAELEQRLLEKQAQVEAISQELQLVRVENTERLKHLHEVESVLEESTVKYHEKEEQLNRKSTMLGILETAKGKLESVIKDLQSEVKLLKNKVGFLEHERSNLESQSETQSQLNCSQIQALEAVLETVTREKEATREMYEKRIEQERTAAEEREFTIRREFGRKLDEVEQAYSELREQFDDKVREERDLVKQKVHNEYDNEIRNVKQENEGLESEIDSLRQKLHSVLQSEHDLTGAGTLPPDEGHVKAAAAAAKAQQQSGEAVNKLKKELEHKDKALHSTSQHVNELIGKAGSLRGQLDDAQKELSRRQNIIEQLTQEVTSTGADGSSTSATDSAEAQLKVAELDSAMTELKKQLFDAQKSLRTQENDRTMELEQSYNQLLAERDDRIRQLNERESQLRDEIERELRSKFSEAAAESHVADMEAFERQLQLQKEESDNKMRDKCEELDLLKTQLDERANEIKELRAQFSQLSDELKDTREELKAKQEEIDIFTNETDTMIRENEQQQNKKHEKIIAQLKQDHERAVHKLQEKAARLMSAVEIMQMSYKDRTGEELIVQGMSDPVDVKSPQNEEPEDTNPPVKSEVAEAEEEVEEACELVQDSSDGDETKKEAIEDAPGSVPGSSPDISSGGMSSLANLLGAKDNQIKQLKCELKKERERVQKSEESAVKASVQRFEKRDSAPSVDSTPRHQQPTHNSQHRRNSAGEPRLCQRAVNLDMVDKWHSIVDQLTTDEGGRVMRRHRHSHGADRDNSPTPRSGSEMDIASARSLTGMLRKTASEAGGRASTSGGSQPDTRRKPVPIEKRPAWKN